MKHAPLTVRLRGDAAIGLLADLKKTGHAIPLSLIVGAQQPGVTLDVVADEASLVRDPALVAVLRAPDAPPVVWVTQEDAPQDVAGLMLTEGYAPATARGKRAMRRLLGWLIEAAHMLRQGRARTELREELVGLRDGVLRGPSPSVDEILSEELWHLDPADVAVAIAEALD